LFAAKVTASMHADREGVIEAATDEVSLAEDTLFKTDKLEVAASLPPVEESRHEGTTADAPTEAIAIVPPWPEPEAINDAQLPLVRNIAPASVMLPRPRPKIRLSKTNGPAGSRPNSKSCDETEVCRTGGVRRLASLRPSPQTQ